MGTQPTGTLSGKIVYVAGAWGQWLNGAWTTYRPVVNGFIEPFGSQDMLTYYADYQMRAGGDDGASHRTDWLLICEAFDYNRE